MLTEKREPITAIKNDLCDLNRGLGDALAKLDAIKNVVRYVECKTDAIEAIKCVLGMFEEEEKE